MVWWGALGRVVLLSDRLEFVGLNREAREKGSGPSGWGQRRL